MKKIEILAPAGNFECLKAAVTAGADAVYLGVGEFNARANAQNFTLEALKEQVDFSHLFGTKVYVAINILFTDSELPRAEEVALAAHEAGADALIVADLGLITRLKRVAPEIELHASTQMGIHNLEGAKVAEKLGISRVVLSRETLLSDIEKIRKGTGLGIETFVQGAQCVAFSGNCYYSSLVSGCSGNRGRCLQLCRKKYSLTGGGAGENAVNFGEKYWLSPKDLCRLSVLDELIKAGVTSFKIEGRMRRAEYVAESVRIYKKAIEFLSEGGGNFVSETDYDALKKVYNRGDYSVGFLHQKIGLPPDVIYPFAQGHIGLRIGDVSKVRAGVAELSCFVNKGDGLKFLREGVEVGGALVASSGNKTGFDGEVRVGDEVRLTSDAEENKKILARERKLRVEISVKVFCGEDIYVRINDFEFVPSGIRPQAAENMPLTVESVRNCFCKLGGTFFETDRVDVLTDGKSFLPVSALNEVRRRAIEAYKEYLLRKYIENKNTMYGIMSDIINTTYGIVPDVIAGKTIVQVQDLSDVTDYMLQNSDNIALNPMDYSRIELGLGVPKEKLILTLPIIARGDDISVLKRAVLNFDNIVVNNLYGLELARGKRVILGWGCNLLNEESFKGFQKIHSLEAVLPNKDLSGDYVYAFGSPPLMTFAHCIHKAAGNQSCSKSCPERNFCLKDEKGVNYKVRRFKAAYCYFQLLSPFAYNKKAFKSLESYNVFIDLTGAEKGSHEQVFRFVIGGKTDGFMPVIGRGFASKK